MAPSYKQEMPPPGGYKKIDYKGKYIVRKISGVKVLCGLLSFGAAWHVIEYFRRQRLRIVKRQDLEAEIGIWPFFVAETHREIVKQMKTNYFEEKELMKNEPHWKVGTLFGEYIYHARTLLAPPHCEMLAHARPELEVLYKSDFLAR